MRIEEDFFRKHVRGFYIKEDSLCFSSGDRVCRSSPSERKRYDTGKSEAVFKIISYAKSGKSVSNLLHYISEHSEGLEAPVEVIDDLGGVWNANDLSNAIRDFDLDKDETKRQAVHFIISFPKGADLSRETTEEFMTEYMKPFAEAGFRFYMGIHTHQSANHAHVLLKMSNGAHRLKFDLPQLDMMRQRQVEIGRKYGLNYQATRRKERYLSLGRKPFKPHKKTLLERQVPHWYAARQAEKEREKLGFKSKMYRPRYDLGDEAKKALSEWSKEFDDPERAESLFWEMYAEKPKTAFWYANHRANVFGEYDNEPVVKLTEKALGHVLLNERGNLSAKQSLEEIRER